MRLLRIAIVALAAVALIVPPAPAQTGEYGCPKDCVFLINMDTGAVEDATCASVSYGGSYLTCRPVRWCYKQYGLPPVCTDPTCEGTTCMYV